MADIVYVAIVVAFLALCVLYVRGIDRMIAAGDEDQSGVGR
jgi:hypothetical protein